VDTTFELKLNLGDTTIGLRCWDQDFAHMLHIWCGVFRATSKPAFWLEIELREGRTPAEIQPLMSQARPKVNGNRFYTLPPLWEGEISWAERWLKFRAEKALFHEEIQPRFLNVLLSSIYNTVCEYQKGSARKAYLFHGCGVVASGKGYLFTGPSGAGKTTVAKLAGTRTVLNDEAVLLCDEGGEFWLSGTPLLGGVNRRANGWHRLQAVLMLAHSQKVRLRRLSRGEAYQRFLTQLFDTAPLFPPWADREGVSFLRARADLAASAVRNVRMYELHFEPAGSFWSPVERL
jgi:hypothetical protein